MIKQKLTQEKLKEVLDYSPDTGEFVWKVSRGPRHKGSIAGWVRPGGKYNNICLFGERHQVRRLAWLYVYGYLPEGNLMHIDRIGDCYRLENLREATHQCIMRNIGNKKNNTSSVKGVSWKKKQKAGNHI